MDDSTKAKHAAGDMFIDGPPGFGQDDAGSQSTPDFNYDGKSVSTGFSKTTDPQEANSFLSESSDQEFGMAGSSTAKQAGLSSQTLKDDESSASCEPIAGPSSLSTLGGEVERQDDPPPPYSPSYTSDVIDLCEEAYAQSH